MSPEELADDLARRKAARSKTTVPQQNGHSEAPPHAQRAPVDEPLPEERGTSANGSTTALAIRRPPVGQEMMKAPPFSEEIEFAFLGAIFQSPSTGIPYAMANVTQDFFFIPAHRLFFDLSTHYYADEGDLEFFSFQEYLRERGHLEEMGGGSFLINLKTGNFPAAALPFYLDTLVDKHGRREALRIKSELERRAYDETENMADAMDAARRQLEMVASVGAPKKSPLTVRTLSELVTMTFDEGDNYFGDRVIAAGQACTLLGPGGIGKSRLTMQLAVCMITGRVFLDMETHAAGRKWLFIQSENSNRRLHHDLKNLVSGLRLTPEEVAAVDRSLFIHTLETDADLFLNLTNPQNYGVVSALIQDVNPDFVEWDPLNSLTDADLNSDMDMRAVVTAIAHVTRQGNPNRVPFVLHHSLTGKVGAARAVGWDKSSYGRNSKVLQAWTRAQINLAPRSPDDPNVLIMSCGKNNNGRSFPEIGVEFHEELGIYVKDDSFDPAEFREEVGIAKAGQFKARYTCSMLLDELSVVHGIRPAALKRQMDDKHGMSKSQFYRFARELHEQKLIIERDGEWFKSGQKS